MNDDNRADKIAEIRKQHTEVEVALRGGRPDDAPEWAMDAHDHRGILLAEVERLRYVLRDAAEDLESSDPTPHKLLAGIIRKALEGAP